MGVTLERVQFKFASIIGELCSEPHVLSQFAVWVDLRIAEYKTNGSISLDCSGSVPNPVWMKGVKSAPTRSGSNTGDTGQPRVRRGSVANSPSMHRTPVASPQRSSSQLFNERLQATDSPWDAGVSHNNTQQQNIQSRLSPDIVVIKDEMGLNQPSSCAFSSGWDSSGRKRPSTDSGEIQGDYFQSSAKSRRVSGPGTPSAAQESSSNQSLMSIINTESPSGIGDQGEGDADIFKVTMEMQEELRKGQGLPASPSSATFSPRRPTATATSSASSPSDSNLPQVQSIQGQTVWPNTAGANSQAVGVDTWDSSSTLSSCMSGTNFGSVAHMGCDQMRLDPSPASENGPGESTSMHQDTGSNSQSNLGYLNRADQRKDRMRRIVDVHNKASSSLTHLLAALGVFEKWLEDHYPAETRTIEAIPPPELDQYLEHFFRTVMKPSGDPYGSSYLVSLRSRLDRHLREHGYPCSIVRSFPFMNTQKAFKMRMQSLQRLSSDSTSEYSQKLL